MAALTRALRTLTSCQVETCPVVCADQLALVRKKKAVRGPVQVSSLVWAGITIGEDVVIMPKSIANQAPSGAWIMTSVPVSLTSQALHKGFDVDSFIRRPKIR